MNVRQGHVTAVTQFAANPVMIVAGTATTIGQTVMQENPNRKVGVWVQSRQVTNGRLLAGTTSSDCYILIEAFGVAGTQPQLVPGTGTIYLKGATVSVDYTAWEY